MQVKIATSLACALVVSLSILAFPLANASLCQTVGTSSSYAHSALPGQLVRVTTTIAGSCTSDGEDYFAVRVDLVDGASKLVLSSNSTPIGYNANNFSVSVHNAALSPRSNETWTVIVNTYLIQAGAASGKYLLNSTTITIQIGYPIPEFQPAPILVLVLAAMALISSRRLRLNQAKQPTR